MPLFECRGYIIRGDIMGIGAMRAALLILPLFFVSNAAAQEVAAATPATLPAPPPAVTPAPVTAPAAYSFNGDSYTRLRVTMDFTNPTAANVFAAKFCPKDELMGLKLLDLIKGDRSAALTVNIDGPQMTDVNLNLYNITVNRKWGGIDCDASFERIDFKSPLYLSGQYEGASISITPKLMVAKKPGQLFKDSLGGLITMANALSSLPAPFLNSKGKIITRLTGELSSSAGVSSKVQLNIGATGRTEAEWVLPGDRSAGIPEIRVRAYLENVPSYFVKPGTGWNPSDILSRSFPGGTQFGHVDFESFVGSLGAPYTQLVAANDAASFQAHCEYLRPEIAKNGFSPPDRALLLWAVTRLRVNMRGNPAIDQSDCMKSVFAELARFADTRDIVARVDPVGPAAQPASVKQMQSTVEISSRFAAFMKENDWAERRKASEALYSWPLRYIDGSDVGLMKEKDLQLANADQWQTLYAGTTAAFASNIGCFLFREGSPSAPSTMLGLVDFGSPGAPKEAMIRLSFQNAIPAAAAAAIGKFELLSPAAAAAEIAAIKAKHPLRCNVDGWKPAMVGY